MLDKIFKSSSLSPRAKYESLRRYEDENNNERLAGCQCHDRTRRRSIWSIIVVSFTVFGMASLLAVIFEALRTLERNAALHETTYWSPVLDDVDIPQKTITLNGTLLPPLQPSIARKEPSSENDLEWDQYSQSPRFALTREDIIKLGKDPKTSARWDREFTGFQGDYYVGQLDLVHKMHCLDIIRKKAFTDYPGYTPSRQSDDHSETGEKREWIHLRHCVDMLYQVLICNADPAIITFTYVEIEESDTDHPFPDFNMKRKCRDSNAVLDWAKERGIKDWSKAPRPKDSFLWPNPFEGETDYELDVPVAHSLGLFDNNTSAESHH